MDTTINMASLRKTLAIAALACLQITAKLIKITATSENTFEPNQVAADQDGILDFRFESKNHSVVSREYDKPCTPQPFREGFFSGFFPVDNGTSVRFCSSHVFSRSQLELMHFART